MKRLILLGLAAIAVFTQCNSPKQKSEWRGPNRTGVYNETGLLKEWPEKGPEMLWSLVDIPKGYSSVAVVNETVYLTGIKDSMDVLMAVDMKGQLKWQVPYGRRWDNTFPDSRCTPTIEDNRIYLSSGKGDLACVCGKTGNIFWQMKASEKFEGTYGQWGISESLLLHGDYVYYTPCGPKTTMIALNKMTGDVVWQSKSLNDKPGYVSPLMVDRNGKKLIVTVTENNIIGVNPESGEIIWTFDYAKYAGGEWKANIQTNTPLYHEGKIFVTNGYDHKSVMLDLSEDASTVKLAYVDSLLDIHHGGAVRLGDYVYGANWEHNRMGKWICLEWETGKPMYETEWENKGSIISAEGMLYCYDEKGGNIALAKASPKGFEVISTFKVPLGKGPHWSHLVIKDGVLYVRHEDALMAYNIKA